MNGLVYRATGIWNIVKTDKGNFVKCSLKGNYRLRKISSTNPVVVGDKVEIILEDGQDTGTIKTILDRKNYISRKSVNLSKREQIIAANIDQAILVITLKEPETSQVFIDRFLVATDFYEITPLIIFNKADIYDSVSKKKLKQLIDCYENIGYSCIETSIFCQEKMQELKSLLKNKKSVLSGLSGVGKSSLIKTIDPSFNIEIGKISDIHKQGKHTTTYAQMYDLSFGAMIIDTPGVRGFGILDVDSIRLSDHFPEFKKISSGCKYDDCIHINEPECSVKKSLDLGEISKKRYNSYLQIIDSDKGTYRKNKY